MNRQIILHFSTRDVSRIRAFYLALGFTEDERFRGEGFVCIVLGETIRAMFSAEELFANFSPRGICDTSQCLEVLSCLSCESRAEVDDLIKKAVAAGGSTFEEAEDHGSMYQHSFIDPDGHGWNLMYLAEE